MSAFPFDIPADKQLTQCQVAYKDVWDAIQRALDAGVRVHVGGDPAVIQVTRGRESYGMRTIPTGTDDPGTLSPPPPPKPPPTLPQDLGAPVEAHGGNGDGAPPLAYYTGDICPKCKGTKMIPAGTCSVCLDCGTSGGCG